MARESQSRIPPHLIEAEEAVLGGVLLDNDAIVALERLRASDFYRATAPGDLRSDGSAQRQA